MDRQTDRQIPSIPWIQDIQMSVQIIHTLMPQAFMRIPTSRPIRPRPKIANVLPYNSVPLQSFLSQRPSFMLWTAGTTGRAKVPIAIHVSSQAEMEFPPGVLKIKETVKAIIENSRQHYISSNKTCLHTRYARG